MVVKGSITVNFRSDACCYLEYLADLKEGKYNRYHCNLDGSTHQCKHWGWCPMYNKSQEGKSELEMEFLDERHLIRYNI